jgi:beta-1,2-mannobiose phosphorylase / 1,2-beta-oligomannan phosphorylase
MQQHRLVAMSEYDFEALKIGAGPPPIRVEEGWLLIHHGVTGELEQGWEQQQKVRYTAGAMLLDADDPSVVLARTPTPLLEPETAEETAGTVPNVVFPTAIEEIDGALFVFYGMADTSIGVARLDLT